MTLFSAKDWLPISLLGFPLVSIGASAHAAPISAAVDHSNSQVKPTQKRVGALVSFQGSVKVDGKEIEASGPLFEGSRIQTGAEGSCTVLLSREAVLHLGPLSDLKLTQIEIESRKAALALEKGRMRALIKSDGMPREFSVRSRAATLGVRGTQFVMEAPASTQGRLRVATLEGKVAVTNLESPLASGSNGISPSPGQAVAQLEVVVEAGKQLVRGGTGVTGEKVTGSTVPTVISSSDGVKLAQAYVAPPRPLSLPGEYQSAVETGGLLPRPAAPLPPPPRAGWDAGVIDRMDGKTGPGESGHEGGFRPGGPFDGGPRFPDIAVDPVVDSPANGDGSLKADLTGEKQEVPQ